jgi:hypothetical protein
MISVAGSQMQTWALFWHIRDLTDQPIALGLVGLARILPVILFSLIAGALADTLNRRKLMFLTQTAQALVAVALGVLTLKGTINLGLIYLLTAIQAVAVAFDLPARQALVPNLVPARDLPNAFSLNSIAMQTVNRRTGAERAGSHRWTIGSLYVQRRILYRRADCADADGTCGASAPGGAKRPQPGGDPGRRTLHSLPTHHPGNDGAGFLCHLLFIRQ